MQGEFIRRFIHASSNYVALLDEPLLDPPVVDAATLAKCLWAIYTDLIEEEADQKPIADFITELVQGYKALNLSRGEVLMKLNMMAKAVRSR